MEESGQHTPDSQSTPGQQHTPGQRHTPGEQRTQTKQIDRSIAALAIPALGALIAEPLFLVVDSALIGHLGATPLAGLAIASAILQTAVGLMVFLAYATTPLVARRRGAGDLTGAVRAGISGLWLALGIGAALGLGMWALSAPLVGLFGAAHGVEDQAITYLAVSSAGLPAMLVVFAATGLLRGLQDTKTPLYVAGIGFTANALLNWWFIYGLGWGIAGSAWGTVIAQWGMVAVFVIVVARHARANGVGPWPHRDSLAATGRTGAWLFLRTLGLRIAMLSTVAAAASHGTVATAGYQVVFTILSTAAFALDALAIAAQALIGDALGARNRARTRAVVRRSMFWGVCCGVVFGAGLAAASPILGRIFTSDRQVLEMLPTALVILAISLPLSGFVYVLDGVLMGAGDARYLAWTSFVNLACYLPVLWLVTSLLPTGTIGLASLTASYAIVFMGARAITLGLRARSERWMRLGV